MIECKEPIPDSLAVRIPSVHASLSASIQLAPSLARCPAFACLTAANLPLENVQRVLFVGFQIPKLHVLQNDFQRVADTADLPTVASNLVEDLSLEVGFRRVAEVDVDEAELSALLIEGHGIDCLP